MVKRNSRSIRKKVSKKRSRRRVSKKRNSKRRSRKKVSKRNSKRRSRKKVSKRNSRRRSQQKYNKKQSGGKDTCDWMTGRGCGTTIWEKMKASGKVTSRRLKSPRRKQNRRNTIKRLENITINDLYKEEQDTITQGEHTNTLELLKDRWKVFLSKNDSLEQMINDIKYELCRVEKDSSGPSLSTSTSSSSSSDEEEDDLPSGWFDAKDARGRRYYYHGATRETTWSHPACPFPVASKRTLESFSFKERLSRANDNKQKAKAALKQKIKQQVESIIKKIKTKMLPHLPNIVKVDSRTVRTDAERATMDVERAGDGRPPLHHDRVDQRVDARLHKSLFDWINELRGADPWVDGFTAAELITSQLFDINIPQNPEPCHGDHCIRVSAITIKNAMT
jgi:glutaredoxin